MKVWRVFNGMTGFCAVHRIVVAETGTDAIRLAKNAGMLMMSNRCVATYVCDAVDGAIESEDWDG